MGNGHAPPVDAVSCSQGCLGMQANLQSAVEVVASASCRSHYAPAPSSADSVGTIEREPFVVVICTGLRSRLQIGLTFSLEDPSSLTIDKIVSPSLVSEWNDIHDEAECVREGDIVTSVNGFSGRPHDMQEQIILASRSHQKDDLFLEIKPLSLAAQRQRQRFAELRKAEESASSGANAEELIATATTPSFVQPAGSPRECSSAAPPTGLTAPPPSVPVVLPPAPAATAAASPRDGSVATPPVSLAAPQALVAASANGESAAASSDSLAAPQAPVAASPRDDSVAASPVSIAAPQAPVSIAAPQAPVTAVSSGPAPFTPRDADSSKPRNESLSETLAFLESLTAPLGSLDAPRAPIATSLASPLGSPVPVVLKTEAPKFVEATPLPFRMQDAPKPKRKAREGGGSRSACARDPAFKLDARSGPTLL